jgi:hypothetical protein
MRVNGLAHHRHPRLLTSEAGGPPSVTANHKKRTDLCVTE